MTADEREAARRRFVAGIFMTPEERARAGRQAAAASSPAPAVVSSLAAAEGPDARIERINRQLEALAQGSPPAAARAPAESREVAQARERLRVAREAGAARPNYAARCELHRAEHALKMAELHAQADVLRAKNEATQAEIDSIRARRSA